MIIRPGTTRYEVALEHGLQYYITHLFRRRDGYPFLEIGRGFPADIHSCGQALVTLSRAVRLGKGHLTPEMIDLTWAHCCKVLDWSLKHMSLRDGSFMYRRYGPIPVRLKTIRWGQGIMLQGVAEWLRTAQKTHYANRKDTG